MNPVPGPTNSGAPWKQRTPSRKQTNKGGAPQPNEDKCGDSRVATRKLRGERIFRHSHSTPSAQLKPDQLSARWMVCWQWALIPWGWTFPLQRWVQVQHCGAIVTWKEGDSKALRLWAKQLSTYLRHLFETCQISEALLEWPRQTKNSKHAPPLL